MDRIVSARIDEAIALRIGHLAHRLGTSKKRVIEEAITRYAATVDKGADGDVFRQTSGAWAREESAADVAKQARTAFRNSLRRHQR